MTAYLDRFGTEDSAPIRCKQPAAGSSPRDHLRLVGEWTCVMGALVEIRTGGALVRRGVVEAEMLDGSGLWLAAEGVSQRAYFHKDHGIEMWVQN